jgi:hypothetical protein
MPVTVDDRAALGNAKNIRTRRAVDSALRPPMTRAQHRGARAI